MQQHFRNMGFKRRLLTGPLSLALCLPLTLMGCLPFGEAADDAKTNAGGAAVKVEDVYAATMALVATTQLSHVFVGSPDEAFDKDAKATAAELEIALKSGASCIKVTRADAALTLDFGAGCAPPNSPVKIQGKVVATLSIEKGKSMTVDMVLSDFASADKTASGTGKLKATKNATGMDANVTMAMTAGTAVLNGGINVALAVANDKKSFSSVAFSTVDPTTVKVDKAAFVVTAADVTFNAAQCYPSNGSIGFDASGVKASLAFSADTASTGVAKFTPPLSKKAEDQALPGLGWKCN